MRFKSSLTYIEQKSEKEHYNENYSNIERWIWGVTILGIKFGQIGVFDSHLIIINYESVRTTFISRLFSSLSK